MQSGAHLALVAHMNPSFISKTFTSTHGCLNISAHATPSKITDLPDGLDEGPPPLPLPRPFLRLLSCLPSVASMLVTLCSQAPFPVNSPKFPLKSDAMHHGMRQHDRNANVVGAEGPCPADLPWREGSLTAFPDPENSTAGMLLASAQAMHQLSVMFNATVSPALARNFP